jgi:hypothetical protein
MGKAVILGCEGGGCDDQRLNLQDVIEAIP